jgi:hypothetical protein
MTTLLEKPVSTSRELPKELADFVDESIDLMNRKELRALERDLAEIVGDSKKIVSSLKSHPDAEAAASALREKSR